MSINKFKRECSDVHKNQPNVKILIWRTFICSWARRVLAISKSSPVTSSARTTFELKYLLNCFFKLSKLWIDYNKRLILSFISNRKNRWYAFRSYLCSQDMNYSIWIKTVLFWARIFPGNTWKNSQIDYDQVALLIRSRSVRIRSNSFKLSEP